MKRAAGTKCQRVAKRPRRDEEPEKRVDLSEIMKTLSRSQTDVVQAALRGESFFFTGPAGSGKTYALAAMIKALQNKYEDEDSVFVAASTGIAACAIGGVTLHSFAGVGLGEQPISEMIEKVCEGKEASYVKARKRWRSTKVLIVDECSMIDAIFFEKLDRLGRAVRADVSKSAEANSSGVQQAQSQAFGGLQIILSGDFFQLPPVNKNHKETDPEFIFETQSWEQIVGRRVYVLREIFRQKDPEFLFLLDDLRRGVLTQTSMRVYNSRRSAADQALCLPADTVKLFPTRREVDAVNDRNLQMLSGEPHVYTAIDKGNKYTVERLKDSWMAPTELVLKEGASVMFIYNVDVKQGICNGTTGKVVAFEESGKPVVQTTNGHRVTVEMQLWEVRSGKESVASRTQIPLILSYAVTIHKSQGMTLKNVEVNSSRIFEHGQLYTAISRVETLGGLFIRGPYPSQRVLEMHPKAVEWWARNVRAPPPQTASVAPSKSKEEEDAEAEEDYLIALSLEADAI